MTAPKNPDLHAAFRQLVVDVLGNDPSQYKSSDIAELARSSDVPVLTDVSNQRVGDMLRSWARNKEIFRGWVLIEHQEKEHGHSRFQVMRKTADAPASNGNGHKPKPPAEAAKPQTSRGGKFEGKIHQSRDDGSMLVINNNGAFVVTPVKW